MSDNLDMSNYLYRDKPLNLLSHRIVRYDVNDQPVYCVHEPTYDRMCTFGYKSYDWTYALMNMLPREYRGCIDADHVVAGMHGMIDTWESIHSLCRLADLSIMSRSTLASSGLTTRQVWNSNTPRSQTVGYICEHTNRVASFLAYNPDDPQWQPAPPTLADHNLAWEQGIDLFQLINAGAFRESMTSDCKLQIIELLTQLLDTVKIDSKTIFAGICMAFDKFDHTKVATCWCSCLCGVYRTLNRPTPGLQDIGYGWIDKPYVFTQRRADFCRYLLDNLNNPPKIVKHE